MPLIAVEGDENSHGGGALSATGGSSPQKVTIGGIPIIVHPSPAGPDDFLHPPPPTDTAGGSSKVTAYGLPIHRHDDLRECGATTIVTKQTKVIAG
jgi:uncharacterized Zn-binding protein involved in type VI secretion